MSTTTAGDLVRKALGKILVIGTQDTLSSSEMDDGLDALNLMLDSWRLERLSIWSLKHDSKALTGSVGTYTIGPGGDIDTVRPTKIEDAFVRYSNADYMLDVIGQVQFDQIPYKNLTGVPRKLFYDAAMPLGSITVFPIPLSSAFTLYINSYGEIESFANTSDVFNLAPGYARAIINNLAIELAPDYNKSAPAEVVKVAMESKRNLKRLNTQDVIAQVDKALLRPSVVYDITSDGYR